MRLRQLTWLRPLGISVVVLAFLLLSGMMMAQGAVIVQLEPMAESGVSGAATLSAAGDGTNVAIDVKGLAPGADARSTLQANTCAMPSASFAALPDLKADATGRATATGAVLFRGANVALATMADGEHIIAIHAGGQIVACGVIPRPTSDSAHPALPATGGAASWFVVAAAGALGLCALSAGLFLRRHGRPRLRF
jgi:LPXTG-motif cell wall-anchored protein